MPEVTITLGGSDEELAVFGSRDQHLRQIRDAFGVKVLPRHGVVRVEGEHDRVELARQVFESLRKLYSQHQPITAGAVAELIEATQHATDPERADNLEIREGNRVVRPRSDGQGRYLRALREQELVFCVGPAGTGKTYLAVAMAVDALNDARVQRLILVRPAVEAGEKLGFLPGDLTQKVDPYLRPLYDALYEMLGIEKVTRLIERNVIEIAPLAYMRGRTLNDAFVILDEAQNTTTEQMKMFLTRIGFGSVAVVTGDVTQIDLPRHIKSGLRDAIEVLRDVDGVSFTFFTAKDVVRHPLVQKIVRAYEKRENDENTQ